MYFKHLSFTQYRLIDHQKHLTHLSERFLTGHSPQLAHKARAQSQQQYRIAACWHVAKTSAMCSDVNTPAIKSQACSASRKIALSPTIQPIWHCRRSLSKIIRGYRRSLCRLCGTTHRAGLALDLCEFKTRSQTLCSAQPCCKLSNYY